MLGSHWLDALELVTAEGHSFSRFVFLFLLLLLLSWLCFFWCFLWFLCYLIGLHLGLFNNWFLFVNHKCLGYLFPFFLNLLNLLCLWLFCRLILFLVLPIVLDRKHFIVFNAILEQLHSLLPIKYDLCCPSWSFRKGNKFSNIRREALPQRIVEFRIALILMKAEDVINELKAFLRVFLKR